MRHVPVSALLVMVTLCFMLGRMFGGQGADSYFNSPHLQIFCQCVKSHTNHRRAAGDLEMLGQMTGLPIQVTSSAWPGIIPVALWLVAGIKGARRAFSWVTGASIHRCLWVARALALGFF